MTTYKESDRKLLNEALDLIQIAQDHLVFTVPVEGTGPHQDVLSRLNDAVEALKKVLAEAEFVGEFDSDRDGQGHLAAIRAAHVQNLVAEQLGRFATGMLTFGSFSERHLVLVDGKVKLDCILDLESISSRGGGIFRGSLDVLMTALAAIPTGATIQEIHEALSAFRVKS